MKKFKNEKGSLIVEASIVFPVMLLVILFMFFVGNMYLQKCKIDAIVCQGAIEGAAQCADPLLSTVEQEGIPSCASIDIQPYRYLIGGMDGIEGDIGDKINEQIGAMGSGLLYGMEPDANAAKVKFNNSFLYATFSVEVEYEITFPIRLLGQEENVKLDMVSRSEVAVPDSPEFIRNINLVQDYMERTGATEKIEEGKQKISEMMGKAKEWFTK